MENNNTVKLYIPYCDDFLRTIPDVIIRSSLFGISSRNKELIKNKLIASTDNYKILFTGEELNQDDLSVWTEIIHLFRHDAGAGQHGIKSWIDISLSELLKKLNKSDSGNNIKWLKNSLERLNNAKITIEIPTEDFKYDGHLIKELIRDKSQLYIEINQNIANLLNSGKTHFNAEERLEFSGLASWLYHFYSSHKDDKKYFYSYKTIHDLCGSKDKSLKGFKQKLKLALSEIEEKTNWFISLSSNDRIVINKRPNLNKPVDEELPEY